jgi:DNA-binding NarL/FixJ family response regulator
MSARQSGLSNEDIARELVISRLTAKTHITRAIAKLGVRDRVQPAIIAYADGLVGPLS